MFWNSINLDLHPTGRVVLGLLVPVRIVSMALAVAFVATAQDYAEREVASAGIGTSFTRIPDESRLERLPDELKAESAIFVQRRLGQWKFQEARAVLGEPRGRRDAVNDGRVTGDIYAFRDPTNRYREFELLFDRKTKKLHSAFIYPWRMTWSQCRDLWGEEVNTTKVANGNIFRSYLTRRLDVLADKSGAVINLGIY